MTEEKVASATNGKRRKDDERADLTQRQLCIENYDWQQNNNHVTVAFEVGCNVECSNVELTCEERRCFLKLPDGRYWECNFFDAVIGDECVVHGKPNQIVLKIKKKVANHHWQHLEMAKDCGDEIQEDKNVVHSLEHVKNSWYEKPENLVVAIYVRNINKDTLKIYFEEQSFSVTFQTRDVGFLKLNPQYSEGDFFHWSVNLKGTVSPDRCQFQLTQTVLNITLLKTEVIRWGGLEAPQKESAGTAVPSNTWVSAVKKTRETKSNGMKGQGDVPPQMNQSSSSTETIKKKPTCMVSPLNKKQDLLLPAGLTGLENLGNTCFMNSVIQCVANTQEIRQYFLSSSFQNEINIDNPLGTGGKLASAFAILMRTLWSGNHKSYSPSKLKNLISLKATQFTGFAQHDAQEFMAFLLDGLHEDLNRIKEKLYTVTDVDGDNREDDVVADEAWQFYKKRNDSVIVDLFQGQYKSKLVCPTCAKVSITFDPFLYLSVPLPKKRHSFTVIYFAQDPARRPVKYYFRLAHNALAGELFDELAKLTRIPAGNLRVFEVAKSKIHRCFLRGSSLESCNANTIIFAFEILNEDLVGEPVVEYTVMQRISMPRPVTRCSNCRREAQPDAKLKRCTNCYRVGYCNQTCQRSHWSSHKANCKLTPELIGYPFVVSLPSSQATYSKLCYMIEAYARFSVDVFQPPVELKENGSLMDRTSTTTSSDVTDQPEQLQKRDDDKLEEHENDNDEVNVNMMSQSNQATRVVFSQPQEKIHERSAQPFTICCVNQSGQNLSGAEKVEDRFDEPLRLPSRYLAIDWQNNEKVKNYVLVQSKELEVDNDDVDGNAMRDEKANFTLDQCLQLFTEPEKLTPDEAWYCSRCKEHREATKQMSLWRLPLILIVQLKRFSFKNLIFRDKIDEMVEFPIRDLDLSPYYCATKVDHGDSPPIYDLYAVINHHGTILGGHYTSYARLVSPNNTRKNDVDWRLFDDSRVTFVPESNVMSSAGYVLFYRRRDVAFHLPSPDLNISNDSEECACNGDEGVTKMESGDFHRSVIVAPFSDMEAVD